MTRPKKKDKMTRQWQSLNEKNCVGVTTTKAKKKRRKKRSDRPYDLPSIRNVRKINRKQFQLIDSSPVFVDSNSSFVSFFFFIDFDRSKCSFSVNCHLI